MSRGISVQRWIRLLIQTCEKKQDETGGKCETDADTEGCFGFGFCDYCYRTVREAIDKERSNK